MTQKSFPFTVSLCGADDTVHPKELIALQQEHPFVEWGLVLSESNAGKARYPSQRWLERFAGLLASPSSFDQAPLAAVSAHLCGGYARDAADGRIADRLWPALVRLSRARRIQINGPPPTACARGLAAIQFHGAFPGTAVPTVVLQAKTSSEWSDAMHAARLAGPALVHALYDPSGGRGVHLGDVPPTAPPGIVAGYAGGLSAGTVPAVVARLAAGNPTLDNRWLCMESSLRDDRDRFDVDRAHAVLQAARRALAEAAQTAAQPHPTLFSPEEPNGGSRDMFLVHVDPYGTIHTKTHDLFRDQGGFAQTWGRAWFPVVAANETEARARAIRPAGPCRRCGSLFSKKDFLHRCPQGGHCEWTP